MQDNQNYSYVSTVIDSEGNTHYLRDSEARDAITGLETSKQDVIDSSHKLPASNVSGLATVATSGSFTDLSDKPTIDSSMSSSSTNAVQNKVAKQYVDDAISGLGSILRFKGTKTSEAAIKAVAPASKGDVWINTADNSEWVCIENITTASDSAWEKLGPTIDLSPYELKENLGDLAYKDDATGNFTPSGSVSVNSYTPEGTITLDKYTPVGTISIDGFAPSGDISVGSGTANYTPSGSVTVSSITPSGSVSTPTITIEENTTTVNSITSVGSLPELVVSVANETLSFSFNPGALPTKGNNTTVMTGVKSATSSTPSFTGAAVTPTASFSGTGVYLEFEGDAVTPTGSFSGTASRPTGTFAGTAKAPTASFTGTQGSVTVS